MGEKMLELIIGFILMMLWYLFCAISVSKGQILDREMFLGGCMLLAGYIAGRKN